jgi:hypothetical protein
MGLHGRGNKRADRRRRGFSEIEAGITKTLKKYGTWAFSAYLVACFSALLWVRTEHNVPFVLAFKYLTIPWLAICYCAAFRWMPEWRGKLKTSALALIGPGLIALILTLFSAGIVIYANMIIPPQEMIRVEGTVVGKHTAGSRYRARILKLDIGGQKRLNLEVSSSLWHAIRVGDQYVEEMRRGGLGFLYHTRW